MHVCAQRWIGTKSNAWFSIVYKEIFEVWCADVILAHSFATENSITLQLSSFLFSKGFLGTGHRYSTVTGQEIHTKNTKSKSIFAQIQEQICLYSWNKTKLVYK